MRARTIIRRTIWGLVICATLIALFHAEEDWRGARALRLAEEEYKNAGYSLDYAHFIPPPIPDAENLAALPIFQQQANLQFGYLEPTSLIKALQTPPMEQQPPIGSWQRGILPDAGALRDYAAALYTAAFKSPPPASMPALARLETVYPVLPMLRNASTSRPRCRFDFDYGNALIFSRSTVLMTSQIPLTKILMLDAVLALNEHEPDIALADLRTIFLLESSVRRDPSTAAGSIAIGMGAINEVIVADALALHCWNDAQIAQMQDELARMDYLSTYRFAIQGELAAQMTDLPQGRAQLTSKALGANFTEDVDYHRIIDVHVLPWPTGWVDGGAARLVRYNIDSLKTVDPQARRVYPEMTQVLAAERKRALLFNHYILPWNFVFSEMSYWENWKLASYFSRAQAWLDHSIIACALERYRLAHGSYPVTLSALEPEYIASVPDDFMIGEPYQYRIQPDGSYLLYSVGWNQKNDGGTLVFNKEHPEWHQIDFDQGDWVWFGRK